MKNTTKTMMTLAIASTLLLTGPLRSQSACDTVMPRLNYSVGCHTYCASGTYVTDVSFCGWQRISGQHCDSSSYVFTVNGGPPTQTPSIIFTPGEPGVTSFTLSGWSMFQGQRCYQEVSWSFTTVACQYTITTGVNEYQPDQDLPIYFNLQGSPIEKRSNELIIEQVGNRRRKVVMFD